MIANVKLTSRCTGSNHAQFTLTVGLRTKVLDMERDDFTEEISERDMETTIRVLVKLVRQGRTLAQAIAILETGLDIGA